MTYEYTQIMFATPQARVEYLEASLENRARDVAAAFGGPYTLLEAAVEDLLAEVNELDRAREAAK